MNSVSLVIPAWNEEKNLPVLIAAIKEHIPSITEDFEAIFVDDASSDATAVLLDDLARRDKRVKVIHNAKNRKLGGSLREGFRLASKDVVFYLDADLPFDLKEARKAWDAMKEKDADIVCAYRTNRGEDGLKRSVYSFIYNGLAGLLFGLNIRDVNFSFKLIKRSALHKISLVSEGSFINVELLVKARLNGARIIQMPACYHARKAGRSTLSSLPVIVKMIRELFAFYFGSYPWYVSRKPPIKALAPCYENAPFLKKAYLAARGASCPFEDIENFFPERGRILDLGCGMGFFSALLYRRRPSREITAVDWNKERISFANEVARGHGLNIQYTASDILDFNLPACDAIALIDVFYLIDGSRRDAFLRRCHKALADKGVMVVKDMDARPSWKFAWCWFQEALANKIGRLNKASRYYFFDKVSLARILEAAGFRVEIKDISRGYAHPHAVYLCWKN